MAKKKIAFILLFLVAGFLGLAQNLVPNGGFESFTKCPDDLTHRDTETGSEIIPHWIKPSGGTADYYNRCSKNIKVRVPDNQFANIEPKQGDGYMGLLLVDEVQEYIQVELKEPLEAGMIYTLSLWLAHANKTEEITNSFGALITENQVRKDEFENLNYIPSVQNNRDNFLYEEEGNWRKLEFEYAAMGGEKHLTLGNFYYGSETRKATDHVKGPYKKWLVKNISWNYCYYLIDDVQLTKKEPIKHNLNVLNNQYFNNYGKHNLIDNPSFEYHPRTEYSWRALDVPSSFTYNWHAAKGGNIWINRNLYDPAFNRNDETEIHGGKKAVRLDVNGEKGAAISCKLKNPLKAGERYLVLFFMKVSAHSNLVNPALELSMVDELNMEGNYTGQMQVSAGQVSDDGWVKHEFAYEAKGGEQYLVLGNLTGNNTQDDNIVNGFKIKSKDNAKSIVMVDDFLVLPAKLRSFREFGSEWSDTVNIHVFAKDEVEGVYLEKLLVDALMRIPTDVVIKIYGPNGVTITEGESRNFSYFKSELRDQIKNISGMEEFVLQEGRNILLSSKVGKHPDSENCLNVKVGNDQVLSASQLNEINKWFFPY